MKKQSFIHFLTPALLLSFASKVPAQTIHLQTGITNAAMNWQWTPNDKAVILFGKNNPGFYLSGGIDYYHGKILSLSANLGYIRLGGLDEFIITNPDDGSKTKINHRLKMDYLTANTLLDCKIPIGKS